MFKCDEGPTKENGTPYMFILLLFSLLFLGFEVTDTDINRDPLAHATLTYSVGGVPVRTTDADPDIKEGIAQVEKGGLVYYTADGIAARNTLIELGGKIYYADYDGFFRTGPDRSGKRENCSIFRTMTVPQPPAYTNLKDGNTILTRQLNAV